MDNVSFKTIQRFTILSFLLLGIGIITYGQNDIHTLPKNKQIPLINEAVNFTQIKLETEGVTWNEPENIIDSNLGNFASALSVSILGIGIPAKAKIEIPLTFPSGSRTGFRISSSSLIDINGLLTNVKMHTFLGEREQEEINPESIEFIKIFGLDGIYEVGGITTKPFNRISIEYTSLVAEIRVYNGFVTVFEEKNRTFNCNAETAIINQRFPVALDEVGVAGVHISRLGDVIKNPEFLIDGDTSNAAIINDGIRSQSVAVTSYISVKKQADYNTGVLTPFEAGTYAGFKVTFESILNVELLSNVTISTYRNDNLQESFIGHGGLFDAPLNASRTQTLGFVTTLEYDEIKIIVERPINIDIGPIKVHYPLTKKYCERNFQLECNTQYAWTNTEFPVEISALDSKGSSNLSFQNVSNIIDGSTTEPATLETNVNILESATVGVRNVVKDIVGVYFVGFEIELLGMTDINIVDGIIISTYLDGVLQESSSSQSITSTDPILDRSDRQIVGMATSKDKSFDEIRITFDNLDNTNPGIINIYKPIIQRFCKRTLACDSIHYLTNPHFSTYIDYGQTGITSIPCVDCDITNVQAILSEDTMDFAEIKITAGVASSASITVRNATHSFPKGSYVGFKIRTVNKGIIEKDLINSIQVQVLGKDGQVIQSSRKDFALTLRLIEGGVKSDTYYVGFRAHQDLYGLKLNIKKLVDASSNIDAVHDSYIEVYGAFVNTYGVTSGLGTRCCMIVEPLEAGIVILEGDRERNLFERIKIKLLPGEELRFFTNNRAQGAPVEHPTEAPAGTYYPFIYNSETGCYAQSYFEIKPTTPDYIAEIVLSDTTIIVEEKEDASFTIKVLEINGLDAIEGSESVEVRVTKDRRVVLNFEPNFKGQFGSNQGNLVDNTKWMFDDNHPAYYKWTYKGSNINPYFLAGKTFKIGVRARYMGKQFIKGVTFCSAFIPFINVGGEVNFENNMNMKKMSIDIITQ